MPKEGFRYRNKEMERFAGWAVECAKSHLNTGLIFRAATTLGVADLLATVGPVKYDRPHSDPLRSTLSIPTFHFESFHDLNKNCPLNCSIVGVELCKRAIPLEEFCHPPRAIYLFGAEGEGLSPQATKSCRHIIKLPSANGVSLNLATAASMVMWDRYTKLNKGKQDENYRQNKRSFFFSKR